jgi:hypothetical protein
VKFCADASIRAISLARRGITFSDMPSNLGGFQSQAFRNQIELLG